MNNTIALHFIINPYLLDFRAYRQRYSVFTWLIIHVQSINFNSLQINKILLMHLSH